MPPYLWCGGNLGFPFFSDTILPGGEEKQETGLTKAWGRWECKLPIGSLPMSIEMDSFPWCFLRVGADSVKVFCLSSMPLS